VTHDEDIRLTTGLLVEKREEKVLLSTDIVEEEVTEEKAQIPVYL
jgi:hypothetical protein